MKILAILFILNTIYYTINRNRIQVSVAQRQYKTKYLVYFDFVHFSLIAIYWFWIIALYFTQTNFFIIFILLGLFRWFILKPQVAKIDYSFSVLKILTLLCFLIS